MFRRSAPRLHHFVRFQRRESGLEILIVLVLIGSGIRPVELLLESLQLLAALLPCRCPESSLDIVWGSDERLHVLPSLFEESFVFCDFLSSPIIRTLIPVVDLVCLELICGIIGGAPLHLVSLDCGGTPFRRGCFAA